MYLYFGYQLQFYFLLWSPHPDFWVLLCVVGWIFAYLWPNFSVPQMDRKDVLSAHWLWYFCSLWTAEGRALYPETDWTPPYHCTNLGSCQGDQTNHPLVLPSLPTPNFKTKRTHFVLSKWPCSWRLLPTVIPTPALISHSYSHLLSCCFKLALTRRTEWPMDPARHFRPEHTLKKQHVCTENKMLFWEEEEKEDVYSLRFTVMRLLPRSAGLDQQCGILLTSAQRYISVQSIPPPSFAVESERINHTVAGSYNFIFSHLCMPFCGHLWNNRDSPPFCFETQSCHGAPRSSCTTISCREDALITPAILLLWLA